MEFFECHLPLRHIRAHHNHPSQVELVPGGREVAVTDDNKLAYIHRVADFRLNTQLVRAAACSTHISCCDALQITLES